MGARGVFTADDVRAAYIARGHIVRPPTTLLVVENTHNLSGGVVFPISSAREICAFAGASDMRTYLDGARLWNASVATGTPVSDLAAPFDLVSVALSKGLCAPGGSVLAGTKRSSSAPFATAACSAARCGRWASWRRPASMRSTTT